MNNVTIYTDGSCHGNPGPGGYAAILFQNGVTKIVRGGYWHTTNNRMELMAVIEGLRLLNKPSRVKIVSDSQYVVRPINDGNLRAYVNTPGRKNADLWQQILQLSIMHNLSAEWVRGHSGNKYNQQCDYLANGEAYKLEKEQDFRVAIFKEMLLDPLTPAEPIAKKHRISINTVRKYQYQFLTQSNDIKGEMADE